jgi:flagellar hook-associated protein 3 FlgL
MRISSNQLNTSGLREIINRQAELRDLQLRMATQRRFLTPADDPVAATSVLNLETDIKLFEQYNRNADLANFSNSLEESTLSSVSNIMFRVKELFVAIGNGAYTENELQAIGEELKERYDELIGLANTKNAAGEYLFAGFKTKTKPFQTDAAGNVVYQGDQGQRRLRISSGIVTPISDSGHEVFENVFNGNGTIITSSNNSNSGTGIITPVGQGNNILDTFEIQFTSPTTYDVVNLTTATVIQSGTYSEGSTISFSGVSVEISGEPAAGDVFQIAPSQRQSMFVSLKNVIDGIEQFTDTPAGRAQLKNIMIAMDLSITNSVENIDRIRSQIGARLNSIEQEQLTNLTLISTQKVTLSKLKDLDVVEAASELSRQTAVLEAAQASFVRVQNLSIFRFL